MGVQRIILEHHAHTPQLRCKGGHILLPEEDLSIRGLLQPADHIQRGALPASGRSEKPHQFSVRDLAGKVIHSGNVPPALFPPGGEFFRKILQYYLHFSSISLL